MTKTKKKRRRSKLDNRDWPPFETERVTEEDDEEVTETVALDVKSDLDIGNNLEVELRDQSKLYAWYATLKEEARHEMKKAKYKIHCLREDLMGRYRQKEIDDNVVKTNRLSETQMKAKINRRPKVRMAIENYMNWTHQYRTLDEFVKSLEQRSRMLQSLNANRNTEFESTRH